MSFLDADALQQQESEWIKVGVDTGAGKTAWRPSVTHGKRIPGDVDLTFRTTTGELVKSGKRLYVQDCDDLGSQSQSSRCSSATVVCCTVHDDEWSYSLVW